jgi:histidinol-phosphate aminotransferase
VGCGSDDLLAAAFHALAEPGATLAYSTPTFSMVEPFARAARLVEAPVRFRADEGLDADALLAKGAALTYVCSPNNPTGAAAGADALARVLEGARGAVVVDEAYAEFAAGGLAPAVRVRPGVVVLRTLSKAFGLAGLRVGYAVGEPETVRRLAATLGPYRVGVVSERGAVAALRSDRGWVRERVGEACAARERFAAALRALGFAPLPSAANFLLVPVADAEATAADLAGRGVRVRAFRGLAGIRDAVRVTVAPWPLLERAVAAFGEVRR